MESIKRKLSLLPAALFFFAAAVVFAQSAGTRMSAPVGVEIQNIEDALSRQGITFAERRQALIRLAQLRRLSGDLEGAAKKFLEAAATEPNRVDENALLSSAFCLAALGEWDSANAALRPLLANNPSVQARFLDASIKAWSMGDTAALAAMANSSEYSRQKSVIYYTLWRTAPNGEIWKNRLLGEFPQSPEGLLAASSIGARVSPLWVLFPGENILAQPSIPSPIPQAASSAPASQGQPAPAPVRLQTGVFSRQANAQSQIEQLRKAGFSPVLEQRRRDGIDSWAVTVPSGSDVNASIRELRSAGFESFPLR
jgi:tetratricopeptide (TPR) repeat protein